MYLTLKLVHIAAVIVWLGGALSASLLTWRAARTNDQTAFGALLPHAMFYGRRVAGPAAGLVLLTGIVMVASLHLGFEALWVRLGFAGIVVHFLFGPLLLRRAAIGLKQAVDAQDQAQVVAARRRIVRLNIAYFALMLSVVGAMVLKP